MSALRNLLWWAVFVVLSIALQAAVPGLDALSVGVCLLLEDRDYRNALWLLPLFILLQEGMGTGLFGGSLIWYTVLIMLYKVCRWLFAVNTFFFMLLFSLCLGMASFGLSWLLAPLQANPAFNVRTAADLSLVQALYVPVAWCLLAPLRRWMTAREK